MSPRLSRCHFILFLSRSSRQSARTASRATSSASYKGTAQTSIFGKEHQPATVSSMIVWPIRRYALVNSFAATVLFLKESLSARFIAIGKSHMDTDDDQLGYSRWSLPRLQAPSYLAAKILAALETSSHGRGPSSHAKLSGHGPSRPSLCLQHVQVYTILIREYRAKRALLSHTHIGLLHAFL